MIAIYKRELKAFFQSVIGWLFIAATLFLAGIYFYAINIVSGYTSVAYTVNNALFIYLFTVPILTMRILTEEKKQKIDQLTFTAPISIGKIVIGKYLAMATILLIPVAVICTYPLVMSAFGTVAMLENYIAVLGYFLYGLASIALCLLFSSFTESQVISAIISFAVMFITYMMSAITNMLTQNENQVAIFFAKILGCIDFSSRFDNMLNGILDIKSIFYFVTFIILCLFLTTQSIQKRRYSISVKNLSVGAYSLGMVAVITAVTVFANLMVCALPVKYTEIDCTSNKLFSISDTTKDFLDQLDEDVTIYVLNSEDNCDEVVDRTLEKYEDLSDHITVEYKDPQKNPTFYKQYTDSTSLSYNSLIVVGSKRSTVVDYSDLYATEINYSTYSEDTVGYDGEGQITSAINYVCLDSTPKGYMTSGHDEYGLDDGFETLIKKQNVEMEEINLIQSDIPEDAEFLLILAPQSDFTEAEADKVIDYCMAGGQILITIPMVDKLDEEMPNFQKILDAYNVTIEDGIIVENDYNYYYNTQLYLLPEVCNSYLNEGVYGNKYVFAPYAKGIIVEENDDINNISLLTTSDSSYSKMGLDDLQTLEKSMADEDGPFDIGVYITREFGENESICFIFGSPNMMTDEADSMVVNANSTVFMNCINECIDTEVGTVSVPVKSYSTESIVVSASAARLISALYIFLIPIGMFAAGIVVWILRRRK